LTAWESREREIRESIRTRVEELLRRLEIEVREVGA
jgi:hypothetical protein